jgi:hypothetical protein
VSRITRELRYIGKGRSSLKSCSTALHEPAGRQGFGQYLWEQTMQYTIGFDGAVSAELGQLLHAVEGQLNHRGFQMLAQDSQGASEASPNGVQVPPGNGKCDPPSPECQASGHGGHSPDHGPHPDSGHGGHSPDVIIVAIISLVIGLVAGFLLGKRSGSTTSRT